MCDLDFFEMRINIAGSVVDQVIGHCKAEASRKPVVMDEHIAQALMTWRRKARTQLPPIGSGFRHRRRDGSRCGLPQMCYYIQPAAKRVGIIKKIGWQLIMRAGKVGHA